MLEVEGEKSREIKRRGRGLSGREGKRNKGEGRVCGRDRAWRQREEEEGEGVLEEGGGRRGVLKKIFILKLIVYNGFI